MQQYLEETYFFDTGSETVRNYIASTIASTGAIEDEKTRAISLYRKVRDDWRYNAYEFHTAREDMRASAIMQRKQGHCLDKSIILITCYRAAGLPARLHLAKVKNHIAVERMVELFESEELTPHGYVEVFLNGKWVACTPAFNKGLCDMLNVEVLEFDGENDSIFQAYDKSDGKFMEYLHDYGTFADFPREFVLENMDAHYPRFKAARIDAEVISLV